MKYFKNLLLPLLLIMFCTIKGWGQNNKSYDTAWKKIDELIQKKNLPKSALTEVKKIYSRAKKEGQDAQVIKSLVYMIGLQQETRENNLQQAIQDVDKEIAGSREPVASILKSLEANLFWQYLQQNRYQLYDRTNTVGFNKEGIATWTLEDLHKKISDLYLQSIKNEQLLKDTKLERYDAIIIKGNTPYLRPTLFDLLAHQALEYFKNDERDIKKPAYAFEIDQQQAFAPAAVFSSFHFNTKDSFSLQQKALLIYQQLIAFHLRDQKPEALIDVDIERIQFVHDKAVMEDKEDLYRNALSQMIQTYGANPIASQASYLLAASYSESANTYEPFKDTTHRYDRIKAKEILERVVKDSAVKSEGWVNSYNLLHQIMQPEFSFKLEKVNIPDQPFRALISYTNVSVLNFRLIKADEKIKDQMQRGIDDELWEILTKAAAIKTWEQNLPATNDLQKHAVEVKIDGLPVGEYILLASQDKQYNKKTTLLGAQLFYVSNISFINKDQQFFVLHRETGQPLSNASIQLYQKEYDYKTSKYISKKLESYSSDKNGLFSINEKKDTRRNYLFDIRYGQDRLFMNEALGRYYGYDPYGRISEDSSKPNIHAFFFTDRSIYRPGQIVYFKTIFVDKRTGNNSIVSGYKTRLYLKNANSETVDSLELTSNEYGSVNGKFTLPQNVLNGAFSIEVKGLNDYASRADFSVEEYKRPKFYVDFERIHKSYKVNDTISL
ncbi:MAG TPA: MG2 domain-containing protein, partial [Flavisolibacter sp.]|nr:MG2 domain-containing protein [Flavisolibacter sp.]